jgi:hypothetical protein
MHKPCRYRQAEEDGRITCPKITQGDTQVSPNICRSCPAAAINCSHLRFTLRKFTPTTILVRYGNGRTEIWNDEPPRIEFLHAACAAKVLPIESPRQCAGCTLRCPAMAEEVIPAQEVERGRVLQATQVIPFPAQNVATR